MPTRPRTIPRRLLPERTRPGPPGAHGILAVTGPLDVAFDAPTNEFFATNQETDDVAMFTTSGAKLRTFRSRGAACGQGHDRTGISLDSAAHR